jgi:hypothetical protein
MNLGIVRMRLGDRSGARDAYKSAASAYKGFETDPTDARAVGRRAYALVVLGRARTRRAPWSRQGASDHPDDGRLRDFVERGQLDGWSRIPRSRKSRRRADRARLLGAVPEGRGGPHARRRGPGARLRDGGAPEPRARAARRGVDQRRHRHRDPCPRDLCGPGDRHPAEDIARRVHGRQVRGRRLPCVDRRQGPHEPAAGTPLRARPGAEADLAGPRSPPRARPGRPAS